MKFRTEIEPASIAPQIDHTRRGFSVGSCFAESIAGRLRRYKFRLVGNPAGVLYNPFSIADLLEGATDGPVTHASHASAQALRAADYVLITFGTAWVYEENGRVVANCEKRPAHLFTRRRLSVAEIVSRFDALMDGQSGLAASVENIQSGEDGFLQIARSGGDKPARNGPLFGKQVIFTLSPVRHLKDGFEENSLSKATLRVAIDEIVARHPGAAHYFPAFEILTDDLRDYRFYGADLVHPSAGAVEYVWEKFAAAALSPAAQKLLPAIENIVRATEHRPFAPDAPEHARFRAEMLARTHELAARHPEIDLSAELEFFN
jgi:hypothetical protein